MSLCMEARQSSEEPSVPFDGEAKDVQFYESCCFRQFRRRRLEGTAQAHLNLVLIPSLS